MLIFAFIYTLIFGAWGWSVAAVFAGKRAGYLGAIAFSLLFLIAVDISTLLFYCPGGCEQPVFNITTVIAALLGGTGVAALISALRTTKAARHA